LFLYESGSADAEGPTKVASRIDNLMSPDGRGAFNEAMASLIRADRHAEADAVLARLLAAVPSEISAISLALPAGDVAVTGWDAFNTQIEVVSLRGEAVTAVGIDITDQGDATDAEGRREQLLETSYYTDACGFRFSAAGRDDLLAASAGATTAPWVGCFADIDGSLSMRGLAPLCDALLRRPERRWAHLKTDAERLDNLASFLAGWLRHLRVHQAIKRELTENGLARNIPVIVGTNEVGPYFTAIYYPAEVRDYRAAAAESRAASQSASRAAHAQHTEDQIARWREQRDAIRFWSRWANPDKRRSYIEFVEASEKVARLGTPLAELGPGHTLSDAEFERMIQTYRRYRNPEASPPPPSPAASAPRRLFGFGRRGRRD
jgi:hypothetical protein